MSVTVQQVFDIAIRLMDAQNESTGSTDTADTKEYRLRTPSLLNSILDRAYSASDNYPATTDRTRPICPKVSAMDDEIQLDEYICTGILPYGLAGLLLTEENPTLANFFWQTFLEQLAAAKMALPACEDSIDDCYGFLSDSVEYGHFGRWL